MRRALVVTLVAAVLGVVAVPRLGARTVAFSDSFNGTTLDLSKWQPNWYGASNQSITKPVNGAETACYDPSHATVAGGELVLRITDTACTVAGHTYPLTGAAVTTLHSFSFVSGTLTARIWLQGSASGRLDEWPAFWTDGAHWPGDGEHDVVEGLYGKACWHYHSNAPTVGGCAVGNFTGWHTYREHVANGTATYSYDGQVVGTSSSTSAPQFIIIGAQGYDDGAGTPYTMRVGRVTVTAS